VSATPSAPLSYDVFVSDGPQRAGEERMPDGSRLAWSPLSSTLISGLQDAVLVDPPFTRAQIQSVGDWVERSGRRLAYIYATHGHGDHWFGTGELVKRLPGVTVYATRARSRLCISRRAGGARSCGTGSSPVRSPRRQCSPNPFPGRDSCWRETPSRHPGFVRPRRRMHC
jgi:hypothetical protein